MRLKTIIITWLLSLNIVPSYSQDLIYRDSLPFDSDTLSLIDLCAKFKTDKCGNEHNYIDYYEPLFSPLRESVERFLEIGILHGASHHLWQAYFQKAEIYGIDIDPNSLINEGRIHSMIADQSDRKDLKKFSESFPGNFNVIIDDGGHSMKQQQVSFAYFFPFIELGGYFIIEDVHTSLSDFYPPQFYGVNTDSSNTTLEMLVTFIKTGEIESEYLTLSEKEYLKNSIDFIQLVARNNEKHSLMCVIRKKQ